MTARRHKADKCDAFSESRTGHSALAMCRRMTRARCRPCVARCRRRLPLLHAPHTRRTLCATHRAPPTAKYPPHAMRRAPRTMRRTPCTVRRAAVRYASRAALCTPCAVQPCAMHRASHAVRRVPCSRTPEFWPRNRVLARSEAIFAPFHRAERDSHGKTPGRRFSVRTHAISFVPELRLVSKNERIFRTRIDSALFAEDPCVEKERGRAARPRSTARTISDDGCRPDQRP